MVGLKVLTVREKEKKREGNSIGQKEGWHYYHMHYYKMAQEK